MTYRFLVLIVALVLILVLLLGFWLGSWLFLKRYGDSHDRSVAAQQLAAWTFAGFGLGLIVVGIGGPILGSLAFARTAHRLTGTGWPIALLWGLAMNFSLALVTGGTLFALVLSQ